MSNTYFVINTEGDENSLFASKVISLTAFTSDELKGGIANQSGSSLGDIRQAKSLSAGSSHYCPLCWRYWRNRCQHIPPYSQFSSSGET